MRICSCGIVSYDERCKKRAHGDTEAAEVAEKGKACDARKASGHEEKVRMGLRAVSLTQMVQADHAVDLRRRGHGYFQNQL